MKFDDAFKNALDRFVMDNDLAEKVERFFLSGNHNVPAAHLTTEDRYLMGVGYLRGIGTAADIEKGIALLDSVVHAYGDDKETLQIKGGAALELDNHYYALGEYDKSFAYAEMGAKCENMDSMFSLGYMYSNGYGVEQDKAAAVQWYTKAADLGVAEAMNNLGYMYCNGDGVEQDKAAAVQWYSKAADLGVAEAMCNLGNMYYKGEGVEQDKSAAVQWLTKAAELGEITARLALPRVKRKVDKAARKTAKAEAKAEKLRLRQEKKAAKRAK